MLIELNEEYDEEYPDHFQRSEKYRALYFDHLLANLNEDVPYSLSIMDNRYDLYIPHGPFEGASYLGYITEDKDSSSISIEVKSINGALFFFDIFKNANEFDIEKANMSLNTFKFLYYFIYGENYHHEKIMDFKGMFKHHIWDGDNYLFGISNKKITDSNHKQSFNYSLNYYIDIKNSKFISSESYTFRIRYTTSLVFENIKDFVDSVIDLEICKKLNIDKKEITMSTHHILKIINHN